MTPLSSLNPVEKAIILKFWNRPTQERAHILDVMTALDQQVELAEQLTQKGVLVSTSGGSFFRLSEECIKTLLHAESYNGGKW